MASASSGSTVATGAGRTLAVQRQGNMARSLGGSAAKNGGFMVGSSHKNAKLIQIELIEAAKILVEAEHDDGLR